MYVNKANAEGESKVKEKIHTNMYKVTKIQEWKELSVTILGKCWYNPIS